MDRFTLILVLFALVLVGGCVNDFSNGSEVISTTNNTADNIIIDTASLPNNTKLWFGNLAVSTDKNEYFQGEKVTISIKNNFEDVWLDIYLPFYAIEKFEDGNWTEINRVLCPCEVLCRLAASVFVEPNETLREVWNQTETWCSDPERISETLSEQVPVGTYRIRIETINPMASVRPTTRIAVYSDEFEIKEVASLVVSTDKNEYTEGEKVLITVINNINESIEIVGGSGCEGNLFIISQNTDGDWNDHQNTCGACEMYLSTFIEANESRTFEWNPESYVDLNECVSLENVSPGSYKIKIVYRIDNDFSTVYSKEFEIKGTRRIIPESCFNYTIYTFGDSEGIGVYIHGKNVSSGCDATIDYELTNQNGFVITLNDASYSIECPAVEGAEAVPNARIVFGDLEVGNYTVEVNQCNQTDVYILHREPSQVWLEHMTKNKGELLRTGSFILT